MSLFFDTIFFIKFKTEINAVFFLVWIRSNVYLITSKVTEFWIILTVRSCTFLIRKPFNALAELSENVFR